MKTKYYKHTLHFKGRNYIIAVYKLVDGQYYMCREIQQTKWKEVDGLPDKDRIVEITEQEAFIGLI